MTDNGISTSDARLSTRPQQARYEVLDGLRGVAAIGVLIFHLSIVGAPQLLPRGYLAVDLFFILSGFVLSHSYTDRLYRISLLDFIKIRLIRLLPLSILGVVVGTSYFFIRLITHQNSLYSSADITFSALFNVVLLPKPWITQTPTDTIFPTDTPLWSLSLEMMVNIIWAAVLFRISTALLSIIAVLSGICLASLIIYHGNADLGVTWPTYIGGALRALFGFCVGMLIWRYKPKTFLSKSIPWISMVSLIILLGVPFGGATLEAFFIVIALPCLIYLSVCVDYQSERFFFSLLGRLSYPLYIIQVPILMLTVGIVKALHLDHATSHLIFAIVPVCILIAILLDRFYDLPVRKFIANVAHANRIAR